MDYRKRLREIHCQPPEERAKRNIRRIEVAIGVSLPESYRLFLAKCGGWWGDICCPCDEPNPLGDSHVNSEFHVADEVYGLLDSTITPRNMITIGTGNFAKYTCLSVAGIDRGAVYVLDGELRAFRSDKELLLRYPGMPDSIRNYLKLRRSQSLPQKPAGYDNIYLLATTFDEYLSRCISMEDCG